MTTPFLKFMKYENRKYMVDVGMEKVYPVREKVYPGEL
jgi:hypothetical protein